MIQSQRRVEEEKERKRKRKREKARREESAVFAAGVWLPAVHRAMHSGLFLGGLDLSGLIVLMETPLGRILGRLVSFRGVVLDGSARASTGRRWRGCE